MNSSYINLSMRLTGLKFKQASNVLEKAKIHLSSSENELKKLQKEKLSIETLKTTLGDNKNLTERLENQFKKNNTSTIEIKNKLQVLNRDVSLKLQQEVRWRQINKDRIAFESAMLQSKQQDEQKDSAVSRSAMIEKNDYVHSHETNGPLFAKQEIDTQDPRYVVEEKIPREQKNQQEKIISIPLAQGKAQLEVAFSLDKSAYQANIIVKNAQDERRLLKATSRYKEKLRSQGAEEVVITVNQRH
jgi:hypothetical protein